MKRCPECEFLYEDEQECCDMDGTVLRFTGSLPTLAPPQSNARKNLKSIGGGIAILLIALVVIGSVLVTLYRATPAKSSSSSATYQPAGANEVPKPPVSASPEVAAPANSATPAEASSAPATPARDPFSQPSQPGQSIDEKQLMIEPATGPQMESPPPVINAPRPEPSQTPPPPPRLNQIGVRPEPSPAKPAAQSKTPNQDQDSKVKSFFKKAGRVLKKPF